MSSESTSKKHDASPELRETLKLWLPIIVLAIVAFGYTFSRLEPPAPKQLKIATGSSQGSYFAFAEGYADYLARQGFELQVIETAGSVENLQLLVDGTVDLAILQGGASGDAHGLTLESIAGLFLEPLWVFHRRDLALERLSDLEGKVVAIGAEGSGTRTLALALLADSGITELEANLRPLGSAEAEKALLDGTIDAAFFVASAETAYVHRLLAEPELALMAMRRHRAYRVRHPFLSSVTLGEGVIDLDHNYPPEDVPMVAAVASLVARDDLHHALVPLLLQAAESVHGDDRLFKDAGYFPTDRNLEFPLKTEAAHYLKNGPSFLFRILPYRTATAVDRLKILLLPFIPLLLIIFKMAPPLYRWRIRSSIYRWYEDLRELDHLLLSDPSAEQIDKALKIAERLELEVTEVSVPLSYMDEFYNLRVHIELIGRKLAELCPDKDDAPSN